MSLRRCCLCCILMLQLTVKVVDSFRVAVVQQSTAPLSLHQLNFMLFCESVTWLSEWSLHKILNQSKPRVTQHYPSVSSKKRMKRSLTSHSQQAELQIANECKLKFRKPLVCLLLESSQRSGQGSY